MIPSESHLDFSVEGFCQSKLHMAKYFCHVFHQFGFSLMDENHLEDTTILVIFHSLSPSYHDKQDLSWVLIWDYNPLR